MGVMNIKINPAFIEDQGGFDGQVRGTFGTSTQCYGVFNVEVIPNNPSFSGKYEVIVPNGSGESNDVSYSLKINYSNSESSLSGSFSGNTVFTLTIFSYQAPNNPNMGTTVSLQIKDNSNNVLETKSMFRKDQRVNCFYRPETP